MALGETITRQDEDKWFAEEAYAIPQLMIWGGNILLIVGMILVGVLLLGFEDTATNLSSGFGLAVFLSGLIALTWGNIKGRGVAAQQCRVVARRNDIVLTEEESFYIAWSARAGYTYGCFMEILKRHGFEVPEWAYAGSGGKSGIANRNIVLYLWRKSNEVAPPETQVQGEEVAETNGDTAPAAT